jgi:hypothetical protein
LVHENTSRQTIAAAQRVLTALIRVLLRHGVSYQAFSEVARRAYVEVAASEFGIPGRKSTISRVSVLTGLSRKEVQRLNGTPAPVDAEGAEHHNRAARVVAGWVRDAAFRDAAGAPRPLALEGEASFTELVRRYSGDMPPRAVLDELIRVGTAARDDDGRVRLLARVYMPRTSDARKLSILGTDTAYLLQTIDHNMQEDGPPRFQRKVMYDNLPAEALDEVRAATAQHGQALIERLDQLLSQHDRDINPALRGSGRMRAGVGIFYFEEPVQQASQGEHR